MLKVVVASISHDKTEIQLREKVYFTQNKKIACYNLIKSEGFLKEAIILSTCNRSEIYGVIEDINEIAYFKELIIKIFNLSFEEAENNIEIKVEEAAIDHIFRVAGGFKSMIIGEDQILGQVKSAYYEALDNKSSGKVLNKLFQTSITFGKKFRTVTGISNTPTSVSSIGVRLLKKDGASLKGKKVLILGLGEINTIILKYLLDEELDTIFIANRTPKEIELNGSMDNIKMINFDDRYKVIGDVDIIISSTRAPHYVIHKEDFENHYNGKPLGILDLALPRDVEPSIGETSNIKLYVIDDLKKLSEEFLKERELMMNHGLSLMNEEIGKFNKWRKMAFTIIEEQEGVSYA